MKKDKIALISAIVLTKNEEKHIVDCLESISFCQEIIVIDDNSEDRTVEIAKKMDVKVFINSLNNDFSSQRNFGLSKANGKWILFVDADERITNELKDEILKVLQAENVNTKGFYIKRKDSMLGKVLEHGEVGNIKLLRLAQRHAGTWIGKVHETWEINDKIGSLKNFILHYSHDNISEFLKEINYYTTIRANELNKGSITVYWHDILVYPMGKFIVNYFLKLGFLDGVPGLIFAIIMSFHSFLVRGKLWLLQNKS